MSPHHAATFQDALNVLLAVSCWNGPAWVDLERQPAQGGPVRHVWFPVRGGRDRERVVRTVQRLDERFSPEMSLTLPRRERWWGTVGRTTVLWCRLEGSDQLERARRFKPRPTIVLQEGSSSRRLLIWAVDRALTWEQAVQANKRLAYLFRAVQKGSDPDLLRIPVPGTCLRVGRSRPVPIVVGRLDYDAMYTPRQIVGKLRDPPPQDAWMGRTG